MPAAPVPIRSARSDSGRTAPASVAACVPPHSGAAPAGLGRANSAVVGHHRRLVARLALCLALGLFLPGWAPPSTAPWVHGPSGAASPSPRLRGAGPLRAAPERGALEGSAGSEAGSSSEAELRARVAELEARLGERISQPARAPVGEAEVAPVVEQAFKAVMDDLPELQGVDDARLGVMPDNQYVFQQGDASRGNPIYKRKYEVLGMTLTQQETYMRSFNRAVRKAKTLESVQALIDLQRNGGQGLDKKQVKAEIEKLKQGSRLATLFFRDIVPEVLDNPLANAVTGLLATAGLVLLTLLFCFCFFPPLPPME
mmetsp:Transcript_139633/g.389479  ORF Transcript_139633/g.389479 Transcript_139633/m.389479 type:complete len:314 (+) Transcript_139633:55-996(+)